MSIILGSISQEFHANSSTQYVSVFISSNFMKKLEPNELILREIQESFWRVLALFAPVSRKCEFPPRKYESYCIFLLMCSNLVQNSQFNELGSRKKDEREIFRSILAPFAPISGKQRSPWKKNMHFFWVYIVLCLRVNNQLKSNKLFIKKLSANEFFFLRNQAHHFFLLVTLKNF